MRDDNKSTQTSIVDLLSLAKAQIARQDLQSARELINRALEIDPSHPGARQLLSELGEEKPRTNDRDWESNESSDAALRAMEAGKVSAAFGIVHRMYPHLDREISTERPRSRVQEPEDEQPSSFLLQSIEDYLSSGLAEEALEIVNAALLEFQDAPQLAKLKQRAEQLVERKRQIEGLVSQARTHRSRSRHEEAIKILESACRLDPENLEVRDELIDVLLLRATEVSREDWSTAEKHLQRVLTLDKENREANALYRLVLKNKKKDVIDRCLAKAEDLKGSGQLELAEQALREGLRQYPDEGSLSAKLVELQQSMEAQTQKDLVGRTKTRAQQFVDQGSFREAEATVVEALKHLPDSSELLQLLESIKTARAQSEVDAAVNQALEQLRQLQERRDLPSLRRGIAIADDALARHPGDHRLTPLKARFERALTENERTLKLLEARAKDEASQSHFKAALDAIHQALLLEPGNPNLQASKQDLTRQRRAFAWAKHKNAVAISAAAFSLIVIALVVFLRWSRSPSVLEVVVLSEPSGAKVYIDNEEKGITPLETRLGASTDGSHQIRIQMENYQDYLGLHNLRVGRKNSIGPISLVPRGISPEEALYDKAVQAKKDGRLLPPEPDNALDLLNSLLAMESSEAKKFTEPAMALKQELKSELLAQLSNLRPFELKTEKELELLEKVTLVDPEDSDIRKRMDSFPGIVERLKKQIEEAIASLRLLTADSGSAVELLKRLNRSSPTRERTYFLEKMKVVETRVVELASGKCRTHDQACTSFVEAALKDFPKNAELIKLRENSSKLAPPVDLPPRDDRLERMKELTEKADKAFRAGKYLTPEKDNAFYYCDEALKINHEGAETLQVRARAKDLMDASVDEVVKEVDQLCSKDHVARAVLTPEEAERIKVDLKQARSLLGLLLALRRVKTKTQVSEIDARLKDLEQLLTGFRYPVVHTHTVLTNCKGTLIITGHSIEYVSDQVKDSFSKSYADLKGVVTSKKGEFDLVFLDKKRDFRPATEGKDTAIKEVEEITRQISAFRELRDRLSQTK